MLLIKYLRIIQTKRTFFFVTFYEVTTAIKLEAGWGLGLNDTPKKGENSGKGEICTPFGHLKGGMWQP